MIRKANRQGYRNITFCCIDCGGKISIPTALYGKGRCTICKAQGNNHPRLGVVLDADTKAKISNALVGRFTSTNSPNYIDGRSTKQYFCKKCNSKISKRAIFGTGLCVSCARTGEGNPNYIHGNSREGYSAEFSRSLKESIRKRDSFECQICGKKEEEHFRKNLKCNLNIHHIDYNKLNSESNNLISLCGSCHTKTNFNRDYWYAYCTYLLENKNNENS